MRDDNNDDDATDLMSDDVGSAAAASAAATSPEQRVFAPTRLTNTSGKNIVSSGDVDDFGDDRLSSLPDGVSGVVLEISPLLFASLHSFVCPILVVLLDVLAFLDVQAVCRVQTCSRRLARVASSDALWSVFHGRYIKCFFFFFFFLFR